MDGKERVQNKGCVCLWNRANLELELASPSNDSSHIVIVATVSLKGKQIELGFSAEIVHSQ